MKQLTEYIYQDIRHSLDRNGDKQIIRVDSFEDLRLYLLLCQKVFDYCKEHNRTMIAKISRKKFEQLCSKGNVEFEAQQLLSNEWVDLDDHMTSYRNIVPADGQKIVVLLLGTDMVDDKGGLGDFYAITPQKIDKDIGKKYSRLMSDEVLQVFQDDRINDVVDCFFGELFSRVPQNLARVSDIMDQWLVELPTIQEVIEKLYADLPQWQIPKVIYASQKITPAKMASSKGKPKSKNSILIKASDFIAGKTYAKVTRSTIANIKKKFAAYAEEGSIRLFYPNYPANQAISSLQELENVVIAFVSGDHGQALKTKLIHTDFSIIDDVLNIKISGPTSPAKAIVLSGMPLQVFLSALQSTMKSTEVEFDTVRIRFNQAKMSGIPSNVEAGSDHDGLLLDAWQQVSWFAGGVVDFIAGENWQNQFEMPVNLISEPQNFLSPEYSSILLDKGMLTTCTGHMHKIDFTIESILVDTVVHKQDYIWQIDPIEDWMMAFRDLQFMPQHELCYLPVLTLYEINEAFSMKDEENFAYWYAHSSLKMLQGKESLLDWLEHKFDALGDESEYARFVMLGTKFQQFCDDIRTRGFYHSISNTLNSLLECYIALADRIKSEPIYAHKLFSIVGAFNFIFTICKNTKPLKETGFAKQVIVPPYHPAMLEKLADRMLFIRTGAYEWMMQETQTTRFTDRLEELISLSSVHNATDAFFKDAAVVQPSSKEFGYYSLYGKIENDGSFTKAAAIAQKEAVFDDDFDDKEMKQMTRESAVLLRVIKQYVDTYPQGKKSLSLVFINPDGLQTIVSALYKYVADLQKEQDAHTPITLKVTVITRNDTQGARTYLAYWINHVFTQDDNIDIKAYLQVYNEECDIASLIAPTTDIAFFFDALNTDYNASYKFGKNSVVERMSDCRFPMVFKPSLAATHGSTHAIDISQPQFRAATAHTQVLRFYHDQAQYPDQYTLTQYAPIDSERGCVIRKVQQKVIWLACLDSAMDKYSVRTLYAENTGIIGFTTGEGSFGQINLAITCREDIASDMHKRCKKRLKKMFPSWSSSELDSAARFCLAKAKSLDGVSILRAMNPNDYDMNNYLAYLIADELCREDDYEVNVLIRLDSYRHWFHDEAQESKKIPDFLLLQTNPSKQDTLHLKATVIEAKIAHSGSMSAEHLPKAQEQVLQGQEILSRHFSPNNRSIERRYWLAQLYRAVVFLQGDMSMTDAVSIKLTEQLNAMMEGHFDIIWSRRIIGCELDLNQHMKKLTRNADGFDIEYWQIGQLAMQNILLNREINDELAVFDLVTANSPEEVNVESEVADVEILNEIEDELESAPLTKTNDTKDHISVTDLTNPDEGSSIQKGGEAQPSVNDDKPVSDKPKIEDEKHVVDTPNSLEDIRVLIGSDVKTKQPVYWEYGHSQLANRHLLITGGSGQGKTYAIQTFLYELARQNIASVVFDYTDGFLPGKLEPPFEAALEGKITQYYAVAQKLLINPFRRQQLNIPGLPAGTMEKSTNAASRFAAIMKHVYGFGEQQYSVLYTACREGIDKYGDKMDFNILQKNLASMSTSYAKTVLSKMQQLFDMDLFDTQNAFDWSKMTEREGKITVIQLTSLDRETQTIITEMLMWDAWYSLVKCGDKSRPFVVVLDEAQNLSIVDGSPAQKILQEGRKYGWSAWFATQFMKGALSSDEISRLQQAAETLYFKPSSEEVPSVAQMLGDSSIPASVWVETLKKMQKGHCIVKGDRIVANRSFGAAPATLVKVSSFEERN